MSDALNPLITDFAASDIPWEGGKRLYELWEAKRGDRKMPARRAFSPMELKEHLPTVCLIDVTYEPMKFITRLAGTALVQVMERDPTGMDQADLPGGDDLVARYQWLVENKIPYMCIDLPLTWASKDFESYSTLVLPLADDGEHVNMLIANLNLMSKWSRRPKDKSGPDHPFF